MPRSARRSRKVSSSLATGSVLGLDAPVGRRIAGDLLDDAEFDELVDAVVDVVAHAAERLHDGVDVEGSPGRALRKRRMPARSGDCTSVLKRVSRSGGSAARRAGGGAPRREGHIIHVPPRPAAAAAAPWRAGRYARLVLLDELLHPHRVLLPMAVARHRRRAAARLDDHVREQQVRVDADRGHMRNMDRMFFSADQLRGVVHDRGRRDQHLGRETAVAAREPAGAKHVAVGKGLPLPPEEQHQRHDDGGQHARRRNPEAVSHAQMLP